MQQITIPQNYTTITSNSNNIIIDFIKYNDATDSTSETYKRCLKQFMLYLQANNVSNVTRQDIINYKNHLQKQGKKITTIKLYIAIVKRFYNFLSKVYNVPDIASDVKTPKLSKEFKKDTLSISQIKNIIDDTDENLRDKIIILMGVTLGLRTIEMTRMNKDDIVLSNGIPYFYVLGKGRTEKEKIKGNMHLYNLIQQYLKTRNDNDPALLVSQSQHNKNGRISTRSIRRIFKTHLNNADIISNRISMHSTRHSFVTLAMQNHCNIRQIQAMTRHCDIKTLMIYAQDLQMAENNVSETIAELIEK